MWYHNVTPGPQFSSNTRFTACRSWLSPACSPLSSSTATKIDDPATCMLSEMKFTTPFTCGGVARRGFRAYRLQK